MLQEYHGSGLTFRYPSDWELTEDAAESQQTITLQTAGASFWTLTLFEDRPDPERILDSVLQAFQDDYDDVDVYPMQADFEQQPAAAADLDFVYLDVITAVVIRAFQTETASVLVMYQGPDKELEHLQDQFAAVTDSLMFDSLDAE